MGKLIKLHNKKVIKTDFLGLHIVPIFNLEKLELIKCRIAHLISEIMNTYILNIELSQ